MPPARDGNGGHDDDPWDVQAREVMVEAVRRGGHATGPRVLDALRAVPRHRFVPPSARRAAYRDDPLPIGRGQTISAPHMVAIMVEALDLRPGMRVLEVGGGSGYHAAVAAELVTPGGRVYSVERIHDLAEGARAHLEAAGYGDRVTVVEGDGSEGLPEHAPFQRAWVAAAAPEVPPPLVEQLAPGGVLLIPVGGRDGQDLVRLEKRPDGGVDRAVLGAVRFVPLRGAHGFRG